VPSPHLAQALRLEDLEKAIETIPPCLALRRPMWSSQGPALLGLTLRVRGLTDVRLASAYHPSRCRGVLAMTSQFIDADERRALEPRKFSLKFVLIAVLVALSPISAVLSLLAL
jgi:hypothetical protein